MRLLYIVPYTPTPIRTRPYHLIQELFQSGHALTLATLYSDAREQAALAQWRTKGIKILATPLTRQRSLWNTLQAALSRAPLQAGYCWSPALSNQITRELDTTAYDVIHVEHLRGAWYGNAAQQHLQKIKRATPVVWDSVDCITHLFSQTSQVSTQRASRWLARIEVGRTRRYEKILAQQFARTVVVSENERAAFCEILDADCENVCVVPNGVDLETFVPPTKPREPATILLTGKMSYHANVTAAFFLLDEIMPRVWQQVPKACVCIAGQNPPAALCRRANAQVEITGTVPDLLPYLQRATVACAPIRYGAGTQNKVLEAMACGTAVVATPQAVSALQARPDHDVLLGTDASSLSTQIVRVLNDSTLREKLETNGRFYVEQHHLWSQSVRVLTDLYDETIKNHAAMGD